MIVNDDDTVTVLGWSYPVDGSKHIAWFYVRKADGLEGWMQSQEEPGPAYPDCVGIDPKASPTTFVVPQRVPEILSGPPTQILFALCFSRHPGAGFQVHRARDLVARQG